MEVKIENLFFGWHEKLPETFIKLVNTLVLTRNVKEVREAMATLAQDKDFNDFFLYGFGRWKSHATLTPLAKQNLPTFGYNMIDPLKSWCWGSILFYPFKISRFS